MNVKSWLELPLKRPFPGLGEGETEFCVFNGGKVTLNSGGEGAQGMGRGVEGEGEGVQEEGEGVEGEG